MKTFLINKDFFYRFFLIIIIIMLLYIYFEYSNFPIQLKANENANSFCVRN